MARLPLECTTFVCNHVFPQLTPSSDLNQNQVVGLQQLFSHSDAITTDIGFSVELSLGVLLIAAVLTVVITVLCVQTSRNKGTVPTNMYDTVGPPQLPPCPDTITTDVNAAYASSIQTQPNTYASTNFDAA